ncbi:MAG TPA: alpha-amylase [Fermentimonas caenicola]|uniref:alpha-amylase family glycosyl hydrolase n=1 Tax=Lascolabacillus sp. TaxID=1924068 RepID=UPI0017930A7E|nr:alpha-amylase family glycosyl hydrolase [Lascolabacillus sp.]MBP6176480.1 alpha-amylase [Fermentimonas sp.]MDI9625428.1 alpha-amylase family glycosyl hydrolase [Bacteroidota bacterium]HHU41157.1 alpha-amylase [Fermentimonas caenicola]MBP6197932.1 alpha-amylase [Fermentimonas sp.]MDD3657533.1 alpha-amylase family glycosyl hydrolase [Lascolabacillus sp.]
MKKSRTVLTLLLISIFLFSCGEDPVIVPDKPKPEEPKPEEPAMLNDWYSWQPEKPDADEELTIFFKAPSSSELYNYTGEVYVHIGIVNEGVWQNVPADWDENISKCKMSPVEGESNAWSIKLIPTIREWFESENIPINKIGVIARSADGNKKGNKDGADFFIEEITDSKYKAFQPAAVKTASMPAGLNHGINIIDNSTVTLVLFDKDKNGNRKDFAHVIGDFNDWTLSNDEKSQMFRDESSGVWWITLSNLDPNKEYAFQYYIGKSGGETFRVADPYSRKILDPDNDKYISSATYPHLKPYPEKAIGIVSVFQTKSESYNWQVTDFEIPDRDNLVIYEMLLRDFSETGDINGALGKLDYLESLGVNAIELMPVQEFDGNDSWGYNPAFFFAMDKAYGTDRMYKEFIDECHKRGIAVILDVVYNHATGANPYARMWWDTSNNKTSVENPFFNVNAPHPYSVFHDFNHDAQIDGKFIVRDFVKRNLLFLLEEYNIDGFRFDLTKGFTQKNSTESSASNYDASRVAILKEYNNTIKEVNPNAYVILEHFADDREETELSNEGMMVWRNMNWQYGQSAMGHKEDSGFTRTYYGTVRPTNSLVSYMESHDEERLAYKQVTWGNGIIKTSLSARMSQLATNAAFFFTVPGPKMIWQFGELGYDISIDQNGRTGKKPIKWDYLEVSERNSLLKTYSTLINLRMDHPELFNSTATLDWRVTPTFWEQGRFITLSSFGSSKQVVVIANFTNEVITVPYTFPRYGVWYNYMDQSETIDVTSTNLNIDVPANSFKIYSTFTD